MSFTMWDYLILFGTIGILLYVYGVWNYGYFKNKNIKSFKPIPLFGNMASVYLNIETFNSLALRLYNLYPDQRYIGIYDLRTPSIWIRDPETVKQITVKDFDHFTDHLTITSENSDPFFTNNLFALQGQRWRDMRATLSPAFTGSKMRNMFPFINDCAKQLVSYVNKECNLPLEKGQNALEVEIKELFTRYTNDVIATSAFGIKIDSLTDKTNEFYMMGKRISNVSALALIKLLGFAVFPTIMKYLRISFMGADVADFFRSLVKNTMDNRKMNNIHRPDMIELLMQAKKGSLEHDGTSTNATDEPEKEIIQKRQWSDDDLTAQAFVFFLAGFETTSTLMTYAAYELASNQDVQEKLRREVDEVIAEGGLTYDALTKMKYMDMFVSETLRVWPPVPGVDRLCVKPYTLHPPNKDSTTGIELKKSFRVFIPIHAFHRDPKYFENPNVFDPERFSDENKDKIQPFTYMPFGAGPRICIGSRFALMEMKTALFHMVSKFSFVPCPKTKDPSKWKMKNTSSIPVGGMWIGLQRRSDLE